MAIKLSTIVAMSDAALRRKAFHGIPRGDIWKPRVEAERKHGIGLWRWRDTESSCNSQYEFPSERAALIAGIIDMQEVHDEAARVVRPKNLIELGEAIGRARAEIERRKK